MEMRGGSIMRRGQSYATVYATQQYKRRDQISDPDMMRNAMQYV